MRSDHRNPSRKNELPAQFLFSLPGLSPAGSHTLFFLALSLVGLPNLGQYNGIPFLLLMFVAMYFLLIAPNQRKQKTWAAMLAGLKTGDRVTTNGGIRGTIVSVNEDVIVVRTKPDGVKLEMVKSAIAAVTTDDDAKS